MSNGSRMISCVLNRSQKGVKKPTLTVNLDWVLPLGKNGQLTCLQKLYSLSENCMMQCLFFVTRKYLLCGYFLGVVMHSTAWVWQCTVEVMKHWSEFWCTLLGFALLNDVIYIAELCLASLTPEVWGWPKMHIFYSRHISMNFDWWYFVIK